MTSELLVRHKKDIEGFTLVPAGKGVFELSVDGELLFSKKELDRFPEDGEIEKLLHTARSA